MIDSHTHLFLCEPERRICVARRPCGGRRADAQRRPRRRHQPGGDRGRRALRGGLRERSARHPTSAGEFDDELEAEIDRLAAHEKVRAIGETGIDYYRETATKAEQRRAFEAQIEIARELGLPIVIHARDRDGETTATDEIFEILDAHAAGVAVDPPLLPGALAGRRTRSSAAGTARSRGSSPTPSPRPCARRPPSSPTSCSWSRPTRPTWRRSRCAASRNAPAHVVATARAVAEVRGETYEELERTVEANARTLFGW